MIEYRDALDRLLGLIDYERVASSKGTRVRYDLSRIRGLLSRLGDPHLGLPTVHVAGTKGKGSTAAMCSSVLSRQGYRTGLFTSPHLHTFRERIRLDSNPVPEAEFAGLVEGVWPALEWVGENAGHGHVTMFEALTAMAFLHFSARADVQVVEVGLGGRLDTTNLVDPTACAITSLSLDHTSVLGDTIEAIAAEKAGIIKDGVTVVAAPQAPGAMAVIKSVCRRRGARLIVVGEDVTWARDSHGSWGQGLTVRGRLGEYRFTIPLLGAHQQENAAVAVGVLEVLREAGVPVSPDAMARGFADVSWPCRMEVLSSSPLVVCDGAHNDDSAARLRRSLREYLDFERVSLVVGVSEDKNMEAIVRELAAIGGTCPETPLRIIATRSRHPRSRPAGEVAEAFRQARTGLEVSTVEGVDEALARAMSDSRPGSLVLATGSLFVAAESREAIMGIEPELYPDLARRRNAAVGAEDRR
ncbi:MAG: bifunctional folylpolyglutamate synthase/dihydrofolate synthase [Dehalococcoidia bacterium]|nr:bifunctional folylpolyglutamate synthase/dihydrofolate synthase [Dehalococcoidia bacterium]